MQILGQIKIYQTCFSGEEDINGVISFITRCRNLQSGHQTFPIVCLDSERIAPGYPVLTLTAEKKVEQ